MSHPNTSGDWMNPPPPGTLEDQQCNRSSKDRGLSSIHGRSPRNTYNKFSKSRSRSYEEYDDVRMRSRSRSKSHGHSQYTSKHSRDRYKRSRSRDYRKRSSRSRSISRNQHSDKLRCSHKSRHGKHSRSRSRSRSRRYRRTYSRSHSHTPKRRRTRSGSWDSSSTSDNESANRHNGRSRKYLEVPKNQDYLRRVYSKQQSDDDVPVQENTFKNDGSFLEMFKKLQEQQAEEQKEEPEPSASEVKKPTPLFGKRRGGRVLKTGLVQKLKNPNDVDEEPKDAWSVYMKEVRKYKEACCDDDSKTRPLVK